MNDADAKFAEESRTIDRIWEALGITTYEQAKPFTIFEHVEKTVKERDALRRTCSDILKMFDDEVFIYGVDDREKVLRWLRQAAREVSKSTTPKP